MIDARRSHADRSVIAHFRDPSRPIYTIDDLIAHGWIIDAMVESYRDLQLGKCPGKCKRYAINIPPNEISIDIDDPALPPVWGINTAWMCLPDNRSKGPKTRNERIEQQLEVLRIRARTDTQPANEYAPDSLFGTWMDDRADDTA